MPKGWKEVQSGVFARGNPVADMAVLQWLLCCKRDKLLDEMAKSYGLAQRPNPEVNGRQASSPGGYTRLRYRACPGSGPDGE